MVYKALLAPRDHVKTQIIPFIKDTPFLLIHVCQKFKTRMTRSIKIKSMSH